MDTGFISHNIHRQDPSHFQERDAHLSQLRQLKYVHNTVISPKLPVDIPGVYTLTGGSLTGKTTLMKRWLAQLLREEISAKSITWLSGELINNAEELIHLLQMQLNDKSANRIQYLFIDDVSLVRNWENGIKVGYLTGLLDQVVVILSSQDKTIGTNLQLHFYDIPTKVIFTEFRLYPLTFHESIMLKHSHSNMTEIDLFEEFNHYLLHGGYLVAMNDIAAHGSILNETFKAYSDSMKKQVLRYGKQEQFLHEILSAIINHYCRPITWNGLAQELSINHPKTIGDYIALLESLDAVFIQSAFQAETMTGAPKKGRKLMFADPFIFHSISAWLHHSPENIFETEMKAIFNNSELCSRLVKACTISHYGRYYPSYHIKGEGEIDLVYLSGQSFWPLVITWTNPLRTKDLKQILKYPNSKILTKSLRSGIIEHIRTEPLPQALWKLGEMHRDD